MSLTESFAAIVEPMRRSTVQVRVGRREFGSGVIWRSNGLIITNNHVVRGQDAIVELSDGRTFTAEVKGRNSQRDLAALQIDATDLPVATVGDSEQLRVGELVFAVGHPGGRIGAVTAGIIHTIESKNAWIQADIQLAPGNSGGLLANAKGEAIGINTMIVNGKGLAIPSKTVEQFLNNMGNVPYLGVELQFVRVIIDRRPAYGLLITAIEPHGSAEKAGLLPGDILIGVRGTVFQSQNELFWILQNSNVGDGITIEFLRGGQHLSRNVILESRHSEPQAA
ncbi:S1C family serine protease [Leptolyngbya sp. NIES-2104]|uniref:S1C family serine protease n=1 Tax=Leptolyngbya sp. NIES-2104 TaxID=1552121 RepID=UPI0006ECB2C5|nr:trypsin-like peptidase domain-containing protein [Leptolyngbya sp. NIES-2104]GAP95552.1 trypsin-like serine proteases, typically periplasmic, contain C-terminal PDZ domain [Leptolyngbya sp. NIES-2104]